MITLYHNSRCSKSREALTLLEELASRKGMKLNVVEYLKTPLTLPQLQELHQQLGGDVQEMVRATEEEYGALNLAQADTEGILAAIAAHPKLMQRPIGVYQGKALVGRPPERLNALLQDA